MAKNCITCGKNIGLLTARIPLIDNEDLVICLECFEKMPSILNELYQKRIHPYKSELIAMKNAVLEELNLKGYNQDTINVVTKFFDNKISRTKDKIDDDNSAVQKICPICKKRIAYESTTCTSCGYIFDNSSLLNQKEIAEIYNNRSAQYKKNPYYEYDYIVIPNKSDGSTDSEKISRIIEEHAFQGWKLITMYSNEIGKNALSVGGAGVNITMCEDILLFERCIKPEDTQDCN